MKRRRINAGVELLFLLRQQHHLYHQLKILTDRQQELVGTGSPDLLEIIIGRSKLIEKLRELDTKLRPIKANWQKLSRKIELEYKTQAEQIVNQVQEIIREISADAGSETAQNLVLNENCRFDEVFAEAQIK